MNAVLGLLFLGLEAAGDTNLESATQEIRRRVRIQVNDDRLADSVGRFVYRNSENGALSPDVFDAIAAQVLREYNCAPQCLLNPLPPTIKGTQETVTQMNLAQVMYVKDHNPQRDGWTCGYRAVINAAALEKSIGQGTLVASAQIAREAEQLLEGNPGLQGSINYIRQRKRADHVIDILRQEFREVDRVKDFLADDPIRAFENMGPPYFISYASIKFLKEGTAEYALFLLGRAEDTGLKNCARKIIAKSVEQADQAELQDLYAYYRDTIRNHIPRENPLLDHKKLLELNETDYDKLIIYFVGAEDVSMRKTVMQLAVTNPQMSLFTKRILAFLRQHRPTQAFCTEMAQSVENAFSQQQRQAREHIVNYSAHLRSIKKIIDEQDCPRLVSAVALIESDQFETFGEVITYLLEDPDNDQQVVFFRDHPAKKRLHDFFQESILKLSVEGTANQAAQINRAAGQCDVEDERLRQFVDFLTRRLNQAERHIKEILHHMKKYDRDIMKEVIHYILNEYPLPDEPPGQNGPDQLVRDAIAVLDTCGCPRARRAVGFLEQNPPHNGNALQELQASESSSKNNAITLLSSPLHQLDSEIRRLANNVTVLNRLKQLKKEAAVSGDLADANHLETLARMPQFGFMLGRVNFVLGLTGQRQHPVLFQAAEHWRITDQEQAQYSQPELSALIGRRMVERFKAECRQARLTNQRRPVIYHFICHTKLPLGAQHWVSISLVKYRTRRPFFVIQDSLNGPIENQSSGRAGIETSIAFLYNTFRECMPIVNH